MIDRERLEWLNILIHAYWCEHDWEHDEDPSATNEMLRECSAIYRDLCQNLPPEEALPEPPPDYNPDEIPF